MTIIRDMLLQSGAFILLLALLRPLLKRHLSARTRYALWLIPALRLMLPFSLSSALSLWGWLAPATSRTAPVRHTPAAPLSLSLPAQPTASSLPAAPVAQAAEMIPTPTIDWAVLLPRMLLWLWLAGAGLMLLHVAVCHLRLRRRVQGLQPFHVSGVPLPLYLVEGLDSPCLTGLFRPRIMLNRQALQTETLLHMVLSHELTHWRRKDHLWAAVRSLLLCAWWWNPLMWVMAALSREDSEAACDEAVIRNMDAARREAYGMSLIALMQTDLHLTRLLAADTAMASGKRHLKERIAMIANPKKQKRAAGLAVLAALALFLPMLFTSASEASPAPTAEAPPAATVNAQEVIRMMTEAEAIDAAKEAVMAYVVYDDGIQGFSNIKAEVAWREWAGIWHEMWVVTLDATTGRSQEHLDVHILPEGKAAVYIGRGDEILWEGQGYMPEIPKNQSRQAWVKDSAGMRHMPYIGNYSAMALLPGAPVTLTRVTPGVGGNTDEEWADIIVGKNTEYEGVSGYVPLKELVFEKPEVPSLKGAITDNNTSLLRDTGLTDISLGAFQKGTEVILLGHSLSYYHVQIGETLGYLPLSALSLDEKTQAALKSFLPPDPFDEIQPGWVERYAVYEQKRSILYNKYGDVNTWTLEQRAEGSQLAQEYDFKWLTDGKGTRLINVVPGSDELSQEEAYQKALVSAGGKYGFDEKAVIKHSVSYAYPDGRPEEREWNVHFWLIGVQDCNVRLDKKGNALEIRQIPGQVLGRDAVIKKDQAVAIARETLINQEGCSETDVNSWKMNLSYTFDYVEGKERELWEVSFHVPDAQGPGNAGSYIVQIDAMTGEVISVWTPEGNG
ncbi:MAG: M56 family metallopeptidase [Christensenellales bacterium]|jgi:beta-lactamase regulating signal transducer with metallopeptidase domain